MHKKLGGLGMFNVNIFWKAIIMSWLSRLITSKVTWAKLHRFETSPYTLNPHNSNQEGLITAKELCKN